MWWNAHIVTVPWKRLGSESDRDPDRRHQVDPETLVNKA